MYGVQNRMHILEGREEQDCDLLPLAFLLGAFPHSLEGLGKSAYHTGGMEPAPCLAGYTCVTLDEMRPAV